MYFIGRTEPVFLKGEIKLIISMFDGVLVSACMPSGDKMNTIDLRVIGNIKENGSCVQRYFYLL